MKLDALPKLMSKISANHHPSQCSEKFYLSLIENIANIIMIFDSDMSVTYVNNTVENLLGYRPSYYIGKKTLEVFHVDEPSYLINDFHELIQNQDLSISKELRVQDCNKFWHIFHAITNSTVDESGNSIVICSLSDITQDKKKQHQLEVQLHFFQSLLDAIPAPVYYRNRDGIYRGSNRAYEAMLGLQKEDISGKSTYDIAPKELADIYNTSDNNLLDHPGIQTYESKINFADGTKHDVVFHKGIYQSLEGRPEGIVGVIIDITEEKRVKLALQKAYDELEMKVLKRTAQLEEKNKQLQNEIADRKRIEKALEESEAYYRTIFEHIGAAACILEEDMTISNVNSESERILGYKKEELLGKNLTQFIPSDTLDKVTEYHRLRRIDPANVPVKYNYTIVDAHGDHINGFQTVDMIPGTNKSLATFTDLSEFIRIKRALQTISACDMAIIQAQNEPDLINNICQQLVEGGGYCFAWVGYVQNDAKQTVSPIAYAGYENGYLKAIDIALQEQRLGFGPLEAALHTGQSGVCRNIMTDTTFPIWRESALRNGYKSMISIPLRVNSQEIYGIIFIYSNQFDAFDKEEERLLVELGQDINYGIMSLRTRSERNQNAQELAENLSKMQRVLRETVGALSASLEARDPYTAGHQTAVARLALAIAEKMKLSKDRIEGIYIAGTLHDIGKLKVPIEILSKPGKLSEIEFMLVKSHCQSSYEILKDIEFPWPIAQIVQQHHERMNGTGYPLGLAGEEILLEARILAVADVVEAMSSHRPYRAALGIDAALEEISQNKGIIYDSEVVDACLHLFKVQGFKLEVK